MENFRGLESYLQDVFHEESESGSTRSILKLIGDESIYENGYNDGSFAIVIYMTHDHKIITESEINELERISSDLIFISVENNNSNSERICIYVDWFKHKGYHVLFADPTRLIIFKRKIGSWDSKFLDMEDYIRQITNGMNSSSVDSILDCGTGLKGVVAQSYYENELKIKRGYACDIWVLKEMPALWKPLKINALDLLDLGKGKGGLKEKSVDVVQAFGFLEHLTKDDGYRFLQIAEKLARKLVIVSAAAFVHGMSYDEKAKSDGNPYHMYNSVWHWKEFEKLGYQSNFEDMRKGITFSEEAIAWRRVG